MGNWLVLFGGVKSALHPNLLHHQFPLLKELTLSRHLLIDYLRHLLRITTQRLDLLRIHLILLLYCVTRIPGHVISLNDPITLKFSSLLLYDHLEMGDDLGKVILLFLLTFVLKVSLSHDLHHRLALLAKECTVAERRRNRELLAKVICEVLGIGAAVLAK